MILIVVDLDGLEMEEEVRILFKVYLLILVKD
jgi:hypothetical protein